MFSFKKIRECLRHLLWRIHFPILQPLLQGFRRYVNKHNLVGSGQYVIWNSFAHDHPGQLCNHVVEAFDMLDVES